MHSEEDDCEEVCIIDAILEERANEQQVGDVLTTELSECLGEQQEPPMHERRVGILEEKNGSSAPIDW